MRVGGENLLVLLVIGDGKFFSYLVELTVRHLQHLIRRVGAYVASTKLTFDELCMALISRHCQLC